MTHQGNVWEKEYKNPLLVTKNEGPQADTLRFLKFLKKEQKYNVEDRVVLDLGCGTGRNANYLAEKGNKVVGIEISKTALNLAISRAKDAGLKVDYRLGDIGERYEVEDNSVDVVLDVTSSNSLSEAGREVYLNEVNRVLKNEGYFFVRALAKDGNKNVKNLLKQSPGKEYDTYVIKEIGLTERVFSRDDFVKMYSKYFKILHLEKKSNYTTFNNRIYKRDYWIAYLTK
ncbi:MAG TPA: class I SAM-dependent methyltransferase [Candidatus Paceibacterota bacterium]|nr:class I SAM-dependent methyltransferase [Candidatus Paceibacterota bacterium]